MPLFKGITRHQNVQDLFIYLFIIIFPFFWGMIHTGNQAREMIKKGEHFEKWNISSCKLEAKLKNTF